MISNKIMQAYKKAVENINKAIAKEIDSFEMDYEKITQDFSPVFLGDLKCECYVIKHAHNYNYDMKIFDFASGEMVYYAEFRISEHTGKAIIRDVKLLILDI